MKTKFAILQSEQMSNISGGNWVLKSVKVVAKIVRDGVTYEIIKETVVRVWNGTVKPSQHDIDRANQGLTHIGSRQPYL